MRAWWLAAILLAACGDGKSAAPPRPSAPPSGDFAHWPKDSTLAIRLPPPATLAADPAPMGALLKALGRTGTSPAAFLYGADPTDGLAPGAAPEAVLTADGGWMRALLANDMAALRRSFAGVDPGVVAQELEGRLVLFRGTRPADAAEPPLPPGDLALRVRYHPLLAAVTEASDTLEAGITLGSAGLDARVRLLPGQGSPTADALARAVPGDGDLADYIPPGAFLRVETSLYPAFAAKGIARNLARHAGFSEEKDAETLERFLREVLTGADRKTGLAIGVAAKGGEISVVVVARDAEGTPSPILAKLRSEERSSFGPLVLDRRESPAGHGWYAWIAQAQPSLEGLPECLWSVVDRLSDETKGLLVAYASFDGWSVVALGPRADMLAVATRSRLRGGSSRTEGGAELRRLREQGEGDYVLGVIVEPEPAELPGADRKALAACLGGVEGAPGVQALAAAGFRKEGVLEILLRAYY